MKKIYLLLFSYLFLPSIGVAQFFSEEQLLFEYESEFQTIFRPIDLNQDGLLDFMSESDLPFFINNGDNSYAQMSINDTRGAIGIADLDGDGTMEIIKTNGWLIASGEGGYEFKPLPSSSQTIRLIQDIDEDGDTDLVIYLDDFGTGELLLWENKSGDFQSHVLYENERYDRVFTMDFDNNGKLDIIATKANELLISLQRDTLSFEKQTKRLKHARFSKIIPFDIDQDGDEDLVYKGVGAFGYEILGWVAISSGAFEYNNPFGLDEPYVIFDGTFGDDYVVQDVNKDGLLDIVGFNRPNASNQIDIGYILNSGVWDIAETANEFVSIGQIEGLGDNNFLAKPYIFQSDMDGDGDLDIIVNVVAEKKVIWFENQSLVSSTKKLTILNKFTIAPNPVKEQVNIDLEFAEAIPTTLTILDLFGRKMWTQKLPKIQTQQIKVNLSNLSSGTYLVQIKGKEGVKIQKIIKQ